MCSYIPSFHEAASAPPGSTCCSICAPVGLTADLRLRWRTPTDRRGSSSGSLQSSASLLSDSLPTPSLPCSAIASPIRSDRRPSAIDGSSRSWCRSAYPCNFQDRTRPPSFHAHFPLAYSGQSWSGPASRAASLNC